jgi:hypothetical protein
MLLWYGKISAEGIIAGSWSDLCKNLKQYLGFVRECDRSRDQFPQLSLRKPGCQAAGLSNPNLERKIHGILAWALIMRPSMEVLK